jgi:hypothetical protein
MLSILLLHPSKIKTNRLIHTWDMITIIIADDTTAVLEELTL